MLNEVFSTFDKAIADLHDGFSKTVNNINSRVSPIISVLPTDELGNIIRSSETDNAANKLVNKAWEAIDTGAYIDRLNAFMRAIVDPVELVIRNHYGFTKKAPGVAVFQEQFRNEFSTKMLSDNYFTNAIMPIVNSIYDKVVGGISVDELIDSISSEFVNKTSSYINMSLLTPTQVYARALNSFYASKSGYQFVRYIGPRDEKNRGFCNERVDNYFHEAEVKSWGLGIATNNLTWPDSSGYWQGKIPTTNPSNIFLLAGGYNCRHIMVYVPLSEVPKDVIDRATQNNYIR